MKFLYIILIAKTSQYTSIDITPFITETLDGINDTIRAASNMSHELTNSVNSLKDTLFSNTFSTFTPKGSSIDIPKGISNGFDPKCLNPYTGETVDSTTLKDYLGDPCSQRKPLMNKAHFCCSGLSDILHEAGFKCSEFCNYTKGAALDYINSIIPENSFIVYAIPSITIHLQDIARIVFDLQFDDNSSTVYLENENSLFCIGNVFDVDINVWKSNSQLHSSYSTRVDVTNNLDGLRDAVQDRDAAGDAAIEKFNTNMGTYDQAQRDNILDDITYDEFNTIETRMVRASHQTADIVRSILGDHDSSYRPEPRGENAIHFTYTTVSDSDITYVTPNIQTNTDLSVSTTHQEQASPEASVYTTPNTYPDVNFVIDNSEVVEGSSAFSERIGQSQHSETLDQTEQTENTNISSKKRKSSFEDSSEAGPSNRKKIKE